MLGGWVSESREQHLPAAEVVQRPEYIRIGLTDAALVAQVSKEMVLLTNSKKSIVGIEGFGLKVVGQKSVPGRAKG